MARNVNFAADISNDMDKGEMNMTKMLKTLCAKAIVTLCLVAGTTSFEVPLAQAVPLSGLSQSVSSVETANPELIQHAQYYGPRRHHRRYFYPPVVCRRVIGWHRTRFGMMFGPYRRCYR